MRKASEYRQHAEECRQLASSMEGEQRDQLLRMADTWDQLAKDRLRAVAREEPPTFSPED